MSPVKNTIDIDDLKRSHVPFGNLREDISKSAAKPKADLMPKFNFNSTSSQAWSKQTSSPKTGHGNLGLQI